MFQLTTVTLNSSSDDPDVVSGDLDRAQRYRTGRTDTSAATPKWSESFLSSWMLLIASIESTAQSALRAMWSMLLRPWKTRSDVTIRRLRIEGLLKRQPQLTTRAAALPDSLIEVPHNDQTPGVHPFQNFGQTGQVLLMVLPPLPALASRGEPQSAIQTRGCTPQ